MNGVQVEEVQSLKYPGTGGGEDVRLMMTAATETMARLYLYNNIYNNIYITISGQQKRRLPHQSQALQSLLVTVVCGCDTWVMLTGSER